MKKLLMKKDDYCPMLLANAANAVPKVMDSRTHRHTGSPKQPFRCFDKTGPGCHLANIGNIPCRIDLSSSKLQYFMVFHAARV